MSIKDAQKQLDFHFNQIIDNIVFIRYLCYERFPLRNNFPLPAEMSEMTNNHRKLTAIFFLRSFTVFIGRPQPNRRLTGTEPQPNRNRNALEPQPNRNQTATKPQPNRNHSVRLFLDSTVLSI